MGAGADGEASAEAGAVDEEGEVVVAVAEEEAGTAAIEVEVVAATVAGKRIFKSKTELETGESPVRTPRFCFLASPRLSNPLLSRLLRDK